MKRIVRNRRLTAEEAAKYQVVREQVAEELGELIARHTERQGMVDNTQKAEDERESATDSDEV